MHCTKLQLSLRRGLGNFQYTTYNITMHNLFFTLRGSYVIFFHQTFNYLKEERVSQRVTQTEDEIFFGMFGHGLHDAVFSPHCVLGDAVVIDARPPVRLVEKQCAPWEDKLGHSLTHQQFTVHGRVNEHNGLPLSYCFQGNTSSRCFWGFTDETLPPGGLHLIWPSNELPCCFWTLVDGAP